MATTAIRPVAEVGIERAGSSDTIGPGSATLMEDFGVRRATDGISLIDIRGDLTARSDEPLTDAYRRASDSGVHTVVLNFGALEYMNGGGLGVFITLLDRARRRGQRILVAGLSAHYRDIFALTGLDGVVGVHATVDAALSDAQPVQGLRS